VSVKILETRLSADIIGDKSSVMDLRAETNNGTKVNIEVQLREVGNMDKRSLFYWSREYGKNIQAGDEYDDLPRVITINIVDTEFLPIDRVHASFHLWEDDDKDYMLTDVMEIHFIDMVKFRRLKEKDIEHNLLHRWLTFFDKNASDQTIQKIIEMDTSIGKAHKKIMSVAQDSEMLHQYQMREMAIIDYTSGINNATRKGEQRGIVIGEQRGEKRGMQKGIVIGEQRGEKRGEKRGMQKGIVIGEQRGEQRGIAIGEQRGEQKGLQKGMQQVQANYLLKFSQKGMSVEDIAELVGLSAEEVSSILNNSSMS
jgi:predicted transposase/invertase (TIGR01784 family)